MNCNSLIRSKPSFVGQPEIEAVLFLSVAGQSMEVSKGVSRFNRQIMYLVESCSERDACKLSGVWLRDIEVSFRCIWGLAGWFQLEFN